MRRLSELATLDFQDSIIFRFTAGSNGMPKRPYFRRHFIAQSSLALTLAGNARVRAAQPPAVTIQAPSAVSQVTASGQRHAAATVHHLATRAAMDCFASGGNAIDAAVAASLMLSVVDGANSGIGGGCLALIRTADGSIHAYDGREMAPAAATPEMFYTAGEPDPSKSQTGVLAAGVPGLLACLHRISRAHGNVDWKEGLLGAATVAAEGFEISSGYANRLATAVRQLQRFPSSASVLLDAQGRGWKAGHKLIQADLADTLQSVASEGLDWFYGGTFAERVEQFMRSSGGMLTANDFAQYKTVLRSAIQSEYRGSKVFGFPPPSSGGIHNAQMLGMLSQFDVAAIFGEGEAVGRHLLVEVMKRAMADRAYWLGDADFVKVPRGLLDADYLKSRAASIDLARATNVNAHGQPPRADIDLFGKGGHTTHLTTADAEGNVVALTQTINTTYGSKVVVPGTGVVLNNELDDFSIAPGVRNAFGLLGSDANLIAGGKRPLSSMSPTIVLNSAGKPVLTCGAAGGPKIITTVLQILVRVLDLGESVDQAIAAARTHHQWSPNETVVEQMLASQVVGSLLDRGHKLSEVSTAAVAQGIQFRRSGASQTATLVAAADPRVESSADAN